MLRIAHVETGRHLYGGAQQVGYLLRHLHASGQVENHLFCPRENDLSSVCAQAATVHPLKLRGEADLPGWAALWRGLRRVQPDLVHFHSRRGSDSVGALWARTQPVPAVLTRRVDNPERSWAGRARLRSFRHVVCISRRIQEVCTAMGVPADRLSLIYSGVDTTRFHPGGDRTAFAQRFGVPPDGLNLGMVAQFVPRKGHDLLMKHLPALLRDYPSLRVFLFSRGPLRNEVIAWRDQEEARDRIIIPGFVDDFASVMPCLDIVVHPARMEGLGVSLLEAAACGVPVVATRGGGIPEVVAHGVTGLLCDVDDGATLEAHLRALLEDPDRRATLGRQGRARVEAVFSSKVMATRNLELYQRIIASRG